VNSLHEAVEVNALFSLERQSVKKRIHEVGFATANSTPEIQTGYRFNTAAVQNITQTHHRFLTATFRNDQFIVKCLQAPDGILLRSVFLETLSEEVMLVTLPGCQGRLWKRRHEAVSYLS
jgi:hypothetical protein